MTANTPGLLVRPGKPTVVEFDPGDEFADLMLTAVMTWPDNQERRDQFLATAAARAMEIREEPLSPSNERKLRDSLASALPQGGGLIRLPVEPWPGRIAESIYAPAGGRKRLTESPEWSKLRDDVLNAPGHSDDAIAGIMLCIIATLQRCHPEIRASLNVATAVMEQLAGRFPAKPPASERFLKELWQRRRGYAPIWAAFILETSTNEHKHSRFPIPLTDFGFRERLIATAGWFRRFAIEFKPRGAAGELLPGGEGLDFRVGVPDQEPALPPLADELLAAARNYRVRAIRQ